MKRNTYVLPYSQYEFAQFSDFRSTIEELWISILVYCY